VSAVAHIDQYKQGAFFKDEFRGELSWNGYEHNVLLRNQGPNDQGIPQFVDMGRAVGADEMNDARGIAVFDYDNDGDLDIAINHNPGDNHRGEVGIPAVLLENQLGQNQNWLAVNLQGVESNRDAIGAMVTLEAGGLKLLRQVSAGSGYAGQGSKRLYFGLAAQDKVERLSVRWPSGKQESWQNLNVNRLISLVEGQIEASDKPLHKESQQGGAR